MTSIRRQLQRAARYLQNGDIASAANIARAVLASNEATQDPVLQVTIADLCLHCEMYFDASRLYEQLWRATPDDPSMRYKAGTAAYRTGRLDAAKGHYQRCVEVRPDTAATYLQLGHVCRAQRNFDEAAQAYLDYISRSEDAKSHGYWSLADLRRYTFSENELAEMSQYLGKCPDNSHEASIMHYALGNVAEQQSNYSQALQHYRSANETQRMLRPFRESAFQSLLEGLVSAEHQPVAALPHEGARPIFVVGLPRSGTTLVEQILAAHSTVEATDELPYIERIAYRMERQGGYGPQLVNMDDDARRAYRAEYLVEARRYLRSDDNHFVDKNPNNFLHIGLIRTLFPEALIINLRRDLRDNAFSMYRQFFVVGHDHAASFEDMRTYFAGYLRLMDHWLALYSDSIRVQSYEHLVRNPREQIAALLGFCGLSEEEGCFEFHRSKEAVMTPSAAQVSQPLYTSSIGYWKHFEKDLKAEFSALDKLQQQHAARR